VRPSRRLVALVLDVFALDSERLGQTEVLSMKLRLANNVD
jgi:hypothetical protein